jgi:hypothetical protein
MEEDGEADSLSDIVCVWGEELKNGQQIIFNVMMSLPTHWKAENQSSFVFTQIPVVS